MHLIGQDERQISIMNQLTMADFEGKNKYHFDVIFSVLSYFVPDFYCTYSKVEQSIHKSNHVFNLIDLNKKMSMNLTTQIFALDNI